MDSDQQRRCISQKLSRDSHNAERSMFNHDASSFLASASRLPGTFDSLPPSLRPIVEFVDSCSLGPSSDTTAKFSLPEDDFEYLKELMESAGWKFRFSYYPSEQLLMVRMPTLVHETIAHRILEKVLKLKFAAESVATANRGVTDFLENLHSFGAGDLYYRLRDQVVTREPDLRLDLLGGTRTHPTLVVETAYSAKQEQEKEKLKEYIDCTNGEILTALGFDIDYPSAQGIRVTVLRAQFNDLGIYTAASEETREIRSSTGSVCSISDALSLSLHDLGLPLPQAHELLQEPRLRISANELCQWVDKAVEYKKAGLQKLLHE
ncbi:uncharacterized protein Z520_06841 [Fonsecaea multimorphosa CBS 102226]|uniref:Uncharacterized protein n=1 Tax=Fonsecaea multimorphosa CBS 102226 TaxID=1442371 RepID=A0A0D2K2U2_9EURO|nr:uncharacterized protein Z520_06841 [Fonsecaea multimorphosa CBS 102226]KIX97389.1 hypothetical protein Z520_06841 [Fonsecaea multimorphosa CBS 102226]OAL23357.1 hypothetical protein AYO22_06407 [Fonsecaea multimorphosa]